MNPSIRLLLIATFSLSFCSCDSLQEIGQVILEDPEVAESVLSNEDVIAGLKQALEIGAEKASDLASAQDGFYKNPLLFIPFPEEAIKVKETAVQYGFGPQVEQFELTLNRAAEKAAAEATPIFIDAIKGMTIADGFAILNGADNAATLFLQEKTTPQLEAAFRPKADAAIAELKLTQYWEPLVTKYNTVNFLTGGEDIETDLTAYVTERAISGLFVHIEAREKEIRENPEARVTSLLQKVFSSVQ